jgi:myo-inositol-1(or 4)-monophosphatase
MIVLPLEGTRMSDLLKWKKGACEAAKIASNLLLCMRQNFSVREKGLYDLVTDADTASQKVIYEHLKNLFPDHDFLGEEDGNGEKDPGPNAPPTWIVDPIDGTTNYVHDLPLYAISIGLYYQGEMVVGVVHDPSRNEMFHAAKGLGAFVNDTPLKTSSITSLGKAMITTGFPYNVRGMEHLFSWWKHFSHRSQAVRRIGSTALNLAYIASGRCDVFYAFDNHVWDVAGGIVLVNEAGGKITRVDGSPYCPFKPESLATNGHMHDLLVAEFRNGPQEG